MGEANLLGGTRTLDLTDEWGFLCGKILGDLGSEVIKIEPPGGAPSRERHPYVGDGENPERSLYWEAFNNNKKAITLDLAADEGRDLFEELVRSADFLVESFDPGFLDDLDLGYEDVAAMNPELVYVSVTPYGQEGPYSDYRASDLEVMAMGGCMSLTGEPDQKPLRCTMPQAYPWGGLSGAMGAVTAHYVRVLHGEGQHIDASAQVGTLFANMANPLFPVFSGENPGREGTRISGRTETGAKIQSIWPCADGYVNWSIYGGAAGEHTNRELVDWMDEKGMAPDHLLEMDWEEFDISAATQADIDAIEGPVGEFFETITRREYFEEYLERGMLGYPVADPELIKEDQQLRERDFWTSIDHPEHGPTEYPGGFATFSKSSCDVRRPAPGIGEHNVEVLTEEIGVREETLERLRREEVI